MTESATRESFRKSLVLEDFVPESRVIIQDYTCPLCEGIYNNPVVDTCGHVFCMECIHVHKETSNICPISNNKFDDHLQPLSVVNNILVKQCVQCKNRIYNCQWVGKLSELNDHLNAECARQIIACPHEGCSSNIFREDLQEHTRLCEYRIVHCEDCEVQIAFIQVKTHQDVCPKFKLSCPQSCDNMIERCQVETHIRDDCLNTIVDCPYANYGCSSRKTKHELPNYLSENSTSHNLLVLNWLNDFKKDATSRVSFLESLVPNYEEKLKQFDTFIANQKEKDLQSPAKESQKENTNLKKKKVLNSNDEQITQYVSGSNTGLSTPKLKEGLLTSKRQRFVEEEKALAKVDCDLMDICNDSEEQNFMEKSKTKQREQQLDAVNISKGIQLKINRAICIPNQKSEHRYVFTSDCFPEEKETRWRMVLNAASAWVGVGVCNKDQVIANKYRFISTSPNFNHASFCVSTNGYSWNANVSTENNVLVKNFPQPRKGLNIEFVYDPENKELKYSIENKFAGKLTKVTAPNGRLCPCMIFLNPGDEITFESMSNMN